MKNETLHIRLKAKIRKGLTNIKTWAFLTMFILLGVVAPNEAKAAGQSFTAGEYIYIKNFVPSGWGSTTWILSNSYAYAHMWGGTGGEIDILFELCSGTAGASGAVYRAKITKTGTYTNIIFTRNSATGGPWSNKWNQTSDIALSTGSTINRYYGFTDNGTGKSSDSYNPSPTITTTAASSITATSATVGGHVNNTENVKEMGIEWTQGKSGKTTTTTSTSAFTKNITGLTESTTYKYKTYVTFYTGTTNYGSEQSFTTPSACPTSVTPGTASGTTSICSGGSATVTLEDYTDDADIQWQKSTTSSTSGFANINGATNSSYTASNITATTYFRAEVTIPASGSCSAVTDYSNAVTVSLKTAPTKPSITLTPPDGNIISGNSATLSVNSPVNGYTYTLYEETRGEIETGKTSFTISDAGNYYVKATNDCEQESPASEEKEITVCTPNATLLSATYNQGTDKIDLSGNLTETCGKTIFYGFLWKVKGNNWDTNNAISGTGNSYNSTSTNNTAFNQSWTDAEDGTTYVFTAYALDASSGNPSTFVWYYNETGIEVSKCITVGTPNITADPICAGSTATLTLNNKQNGVTYTLGDDTPIFTDGDEYTTPTLNTNTTYTITATSTNSCDADQKETATVTVTVNELPEAPVLGETEETVCPNTQFTLPTIDGKWYAQEEGGSAYVSNTITNGVAATTYYYAEAVKYGCSSATRTRYTVNVHTAPVAPVITLNPTTVGQDKNSELSISNESYSPSNTKYELYKDGEKVGEMLSQTTNVSSSDVGNVIYSVKATHKECAALTSTSNTVTLTVQEAGAIIAALGDLKVDPQDPVDFVAMYVKNDGLADFSAQGATEVTGYTWQFSSDDGNNWTNCASTNVVDGVNYELGMENGSANCNNFRPNVAGKYRCVVKYDVGEQPSNILTVTSDGSTDKTFNGVTMTLPVVSVNTGAGNFPVNDFGGTPSKNASSDKMKAKISVDVKIFENINGTTQVVYDRKARMNYRGSSSMNFLKKSYAFCPGDEMCGDKKGVDYVKTAKLNMLGIGNALDKDWVLYAAAADPSLMRNRLMFDTFRDMTGGWSVNSRYVELVVNGEYRGVYVMMDKITKNDNRINVKWKIDKNTGETTQKGFIIKLDKTDIEDRYENNGDKKTFKSKYSGHDGFDTYDTEIDQRFEIEYPEKEDIEDDGGDWSIVYNEILGMVNKFEEELAKGNFTEVQKLIDYESWADWFIITEYGKNIDGYRASNLFVFDENGKGKLEARPLWDQELSFDNKCPSYYGSYGSSNTSGLLIDKTNSAVYDNDASAPFWFTGKYKGGRGTYNGSDQIFKGLLDDPCFVAVLQSRWEKHVSGALSQKSLTDKENIYISELGNIGTNGTPMNRELKFWQNNKGRHYIDCGTGAEKSCYNGTTGYSSYNTSESITQSATDLTNWLKGDRRTNLGNIINNMEGTDLRISLTMTPANGETTPWEAVMVEVNNPSGYDYDLEYTTNTLDKVEGVIINENNDKYTYRIPRPSDWGVGDGARDAIQYGIKATLKVGDSDVQCGSSVGDTTTDTATITLKDEEDDNCSIVEP